MPFLVNNAYKNNLIMNIMIKCVKDL